MTNSFYKKLITYIFSGLAIVTLSTMVYVYIQLQDLDNIKNIVVKKIEELTGRKVFIGEAELAFEKGISIRIKNLSIYSYKGMKQDFSARNAWCVIKLWPLLNKEIQVKKFILDGAHIELARDEQGNFNLGDPFLLLNVKKTSGLLKLIGAGVMHQISVSNSDVRFNDYYKGLSSKPYLTSVNSINLTVEKRLFQNIFSINLSGKIANQYQDTELYLSGGIDSFENKEKNQPVFIQGKVKINQFYVSQLRPYFKNISLSISDKTKLSLESTISGNLLGVLRAKGQLKFIEIMEEQKVGSANAASQRKGEIDYSFELDKNFINLQELKIHSGQSNFFGKGKLVRHKSLDPEVSFTIQTNEFEIEETRKNLSLMLFPEQFHKEVNRFLDNGTLEIKSLNYEGSLKQLQKLDLEQNKNLFTADIGFNKINLKTPLPPLEKVSGFFEYKNGDGTIEITNARFRDLPIGNIKGIVKDVINSPLADLSIKSEIDLGRLNHVLKKVINGKTYENIIDDYQEVKGIGLVEAKIQGPLSDIEKTSMAAVLSVKNASFFDSELQSRVTNFNGKIHFNHFPMHDKDQTKPSVPIIEGKNLSGNFGRSEFYSMQGKILRQGEKIVQKIEAVYRLNAAELPKAIADINFSSPEFVLLKQASFEQGDVEVKYRSLMDFDKPEEEESWGEIELKNISIKNISGFQPMAGLIGEISFGDGSININKLEGLYGGAPISLNGQMAPKSNTLIDFDIHASLTDITETNLKGIPYFNELKFSGPLNLEISLSGNRHNLKFKSKFDLTKVGYELKKIISKKESMSNLFEMKGSYTEREGILFNQFKFTLDGNSLIGEAKIKSFSDPEYFIKLSGVGFEVSVMKRLVDFFENSTEGKIDFQVLGQGNLNKPEDSFFKGSAALKDLVFKWKDRKNPLTLSADARFSGNTYNLRAGRMESGRSKVLFRGKYKNGEQPELLLELTGKTLIIDELISNKKNEGKNEVNLGKLFETSQFLSKGKSKIKVNLTQLDYKQLTLGDISGTFLLKNKEIIFDRFRIGSNNQIEGQGKFSIKGPDSISFETRVKADEIEAKKFFEIFGEHFKGGLVGKFKNLKLILKSRGQKFSENIQNLNGKLSFHLANGEIDTKKLHEGVFSLFGFERPLETKNKKEKNKEKERSKYERISGDFIYTGGIAETNNLVYETDQRKSVIAGKFDLNELEMDTEVGVAHLPGLDKLLTQIPIVGSILTAGNEGSLIKTYYDVNGPFDNPKVTAIPFTSLSKKFIGLFQGVLQSSEEILNLPEAIGVGDITD
ncbi:MAG: hypothetical protein HOB32_09355 [Nitrospina sp.]|nr:hypothetical protein [Nitrospina sp.]